MKTYKQFIAEIEVGQSASHPSGQYVWKGAQWVKTSGQIAKKEVAADLNKQHNPEPPAPDPDPETKPKPVVKTPIKKKPVNSEPEKIEVKKMNDQHSYKTHVWDKRRNRNSSATRYFKTATADKIKQGVGTAANFLVTGRTEVTQRTK